MIVKREEMQKEQREHMREGKGTVEIVHLVPGGELPHGRLMAEIVIPEGASIGEHAHTQETEYYIITAGEGVVRDNGVDMPVKAGEVVVTPDGSSHSIENTGKGDLTMIAVILTY